MKGAIKMFKKGSLESRVRVASMKQKSRQSAVCGQGSFARGHVLFFVGMALCLMAGTVSAMTLNCAFPWSEKFSPPQNPLYAFSFPTAADAELPMFKTGDRVRIRVQAGVRSPFMKWSVSRCKITKPVAEGRVADSAGYVYWIDVPTAALKAPAFYTLKVEQDFYVPAAKDFALDGKLAKRPSVGICTFGWNIDKKPVPEYRPKDLKAFWDRAKSAYVDGIPLDPKENVEPAKRKVYSKAEIDAYNVQEAGMPPDFDPDWPHRAERVESCKVTIAGIKPGERIYGWLAKPADAKPGQKFPAMLVLPGAGNGPRPRPLDHARHGYLAIDVQVHGSDLDLPPMGADKEEIKDRYVPFGAAHFIDNSAPDKVWYFGVYLRAMRMLTYIASRDDVDARRIVVTGGSQGGRLSIALAALYPDLVKAAIPSIAHFSNQYELFWTREENTRGGDGMTDVLPVLDPHLDDGHGNSQLWIAAYYDPMNLSPWIKCPVRFMAGTIDPVSEPFGTWAAYQRCGSADKHFVWLVGQGHDWSAAADRAAYRWLDKIWMK